MEGLRELNDSEIEQIYNIGYRVIIEKTEHGVNKFVKYDAVKVRIYRYRGIMEFHISYSESKYGNRLDEVARDAEMSEIKAPNLRIVKDISKTKFEEWLDYRVRNFRALEGKYEEFLRYYSERQKECKKLNGKWVYNSYSQDVAAKEGKEVWKYKEDRFELENEYLKVSKNIYGYVSMTLYDWRIDDKLDFFKKIEKAFKLRRK